MADITLVNPTSNQILVYNELTGNLENVDLTPDLIQNFTYIRGAINIGSANSKSLYNDTLNSTLRFKGIIGQNGISVNNVGADIQISFDGDASTLGGIGRTGYLQVSNNLNELDPVQARSTLEVMSVNEAYDSFLEANTSNVPDVDNAYDFGSNGRRFANMFAVNFHGHATSSGIANALSRNGATDGQILVWRTAQDKWVPEDMTTNRLNTLSDVDVTNLQHESVLVFNSVRNKWETVPASFFGGGDGGGSGVIMAASNTGTGVGVYSTLLGNTFQFRTIKAGQNINVGLNFDGSEINISAVVPQTTGDLPEGANWYYTRNRLLSDLETISIQQLGNVNTTTSPTNGQAPVWNGSRWDWVTVNSGILSTDNLVEGTSNLYFTESRANTAIQNYIDLVGVELNDLSNVNTTPSNNDYLYFNAATNSWLSKKVRITELSDVDISSIADNGILVWNSATSTFVNGELPTRLEQLQSTPQSMAFNQDSFNDFFDLKTTADITEDAQYKFLTNSNLITELATVSINELSDVNINGISTGNILVWNGGSFVPADASSLNITVSVRMSELTDVDSVAMTNITNNQVLAYDAVSELFKPVSIPNTVNGSTDVQISGIQNGQGLVWDSGKYVNRFVVSTNSVFSDGELVAYNAATQQFENKDISSIQSTIFNISGTSYSNLSDKDILIYNNLTSVFENKPLTVSMLSDVSGTATNNSVIVYNSTTMQYEHKELSISNIAGVNLTPDTDQYLTIDGSGNIINQTLSLSALSDVNIISPSEGQILKYNEVDGEFQNSSLSIRDLSDVTDDAAALDNVLAWDGVQYVNRSAFIYDPLTLNDGDMPIFNGVSFSFSNILEILRINETTKLDGYVLTYNQDQDELIYAQPTTSLSNLTDVNTSTQQDGYVLTYDAAENKYIPKPPTGGTGPSNGGIYEFIATAGQTVFSLPHDGTVMVFANGALLPSSEVDALDTASITLTTPRNAGDEIRVMVVSTAPISGGGSLNGNVYEFTATAGQTVFPATHNNSPIMVFANGALLFSTDYITTDPTQIELNVGRIVGDTITILIMQ